MELQYVKELEKQGLNIKDLPEDARVGITELSKALTIIKTNESRGIKPKPSTMKKIKAMDKWIWYEILDMQSNTDKNEEKIPYESEDIKEDLEQNDNSEQDNNDESKEEEFKKEVKTNVDGSKVDLELQQMYKSGKAEWTINEIKNSAPNTYDAIFDVYEAGEQNGVQTTSYSLLEFEEQKYKLTKI